MQPYEVAYAGAVKGFWVSGTLMAAWVVSKWLIPRLLPRFGESRVGKVTQRVLLWGAVAWFFDAGSLWMSAFGRNALGWGCYGLSILFRLVLLIAVIGALTKPTDVAKEG